MTIKYLKTTVGSGALNLDSVSNLLGNVTTFYQSITFANSTVSTSATTGALTVAGGVGIGGQLNVSGAVNVDGSLRAFSANFTTNATIAGTLTSTNIQNSGYINSSSATIGLLNSQTLAVSGQGTFDSLQVNNLANVGSITALSGTVTNLSTTTLNTGTLAATTTVSAPTVAADNITPNTGIQINFGQPDKVRITGGVNGQVLTTDGNGNLYWADGPGFLTVGNGLSRTGNQISLAGTGFAPGVYDRVTVDEYGRVVSGVAVTDTLDVVAQRGASTGQIISLTNATNSTGVTDGALVVTGGVGVGATLTANQLVSKTTITAEQQFYALHTSSFSKTASFNGTDTGTVPIKIKSGSLIPGADLGSLEFDGNYLYITTLLGRQVLAAREASVSSPVAAVKAVATRNINIAAATQTVDVNGDTIDCWDDVILLSSDRILLTLQNDAKENGVYVFAGEGQPLVRASDFDTVNGIHNGTIIFVAQGTLNKGSYYQIETPNPIVVNTTDISIIQNFNRNNIAVSSLAKNSTSGLIARTSYGEVALRSIASNTSWITVANADSKSGNPTINTSTIPVSAGGTGRTNIIGWMRGTGTSIVSSQTIPLGNIAGAGTMAAQNANAVAISGGTISVSTVTASGATTTNTLSANTATVTGNTSVNNVSANNITVTDLTVTGNTSVSNLYGNVLPLGANTVGSLNTAAVSVSSTQNITDTIALMNVVLGKLVPPPPPNFPNGQSLSISSLTTARMTNFVQTDNTPGQNSGVAAGTVINNIRRGSSYQTNTITGSGPGDGGTVTVYKNGQVAGFKNMTPGGNGTFSDLVISNNQDYNLINSAVTPNFWYSFDARAAGTVTAGWNQVYITHNVGSPTNTTTWYYDSSSPGTPQFTNTTITEDANVAAYSSTIPHYTTGSRFDISFDINRLSGDTYPTTDNFAIGTAGGAFDTPTTITYAAAGIATPLTRNYALSSTVNVTTLAAIKSGFGSSSLGPTITVDNSYATASHTFAPGVTILYKTGTGNQIEETSIPVNSVGTGSGNGYRIINPGSSDTPAYSANANTFNSQSSTLQPYDATVVAAVLKHDQTNYSSGYLPVGPDLSSGRTGSQYFTFNFVRSVVSKFDVKYTGTLAGLWVALPGSAIDSSSTLNGWIDLSAAYAGAGIPGAGTGGNGSNGASVGGSAVLNSAQTNKRVTATFGTASSSSTATNEIYVRVKLTAGQSLTAISIEAASN